MGIRGLTALLSDDRRRFGEPWSLTLPSRRTAPSPNGSDGDCGGGAGSGAATTTTIVYVDGPALLYHLLSPPAAGGGGGDGPSSSSLPPPAARAPQRHKGRFDALPSEVRSLAYSFVSALLSAGASEVHLVLDGLASELKDGTRLERCAKNCEVADGLARRYLSGGRGGGGAEGEVVPHLYAMRAVTEAFEDLMREEEDRSKRVFVHRARGEAEGCIAGLIASRPDCQAQGPGENVNETNEEKEEDVVVLSNDTDLLVYPSVPGFVPLRSLSFLSNEGKDNGDNDDNEGRISVTGWRYLRSKLVSAYHLPPPRNDRDVSSLAVIAALAGCDYVPADGRLAARLRSARGRVVGSNIGGLRARFRNAGSNATSRATAQAVLRYVGHFSSKGAGQRRKLPQSADEDSIGGNADNDEDEDLVWMRRLCRSATVGGSGRSDCVIDGSGASAEELLEALLAVRAAYLGDLSAVRGDDDDKNDDRDGDDVGVRLLLERSAFHCAPVVETWSGSSKKSGKHNKRRSSPKRKKKASKKAASSSNDSVASTGYDSVCGDRPAGSSKSAWMDPSFVTARKRLYGVLKLCGAFQDDDARPSWSNRYGGRGTAFTVSEFCRCTNENGAPSYKEFDVELRSGHTTGSIVLDSFLKDLAKTKRPAGCETSEELFWASLEYCLRDRRKDADEASAVSSSPGPSLQDMIKSVQPDRHRVLLAGLLLSKPEDALAIIISSTVPASELGSSCNTMARGRLRASALSSIACLHVDVIVGSLSKVIFGSDTYLQRLRASETFSNDSVASLAWEQAKAEIKALTFSGGPSDNVPCDNTAQDIQSYLFQDVFAGVLSKTAKREDSEPVEEKVVMSEKLWRQTASALWSAWCSHHAD